MTMIIYELIWFLTFPKNLLELWDREKGWYTYQIVSAAFAPGWGRKAKQIYKNTEIELISKYWSPTSIKEVGDLSIFYFYSY